MKLCHEYNVRLLVVLVMSLCLTMSMASTAPNNLASATDRYRGLFCSFPAIFNFGDSNSDTGGLSALFGPFPPPYGETFFGKPAGRMSNGRLIIDFIASTLGLPFLSPYLDSVGTNFFHGANFATAGSPVIAPTVTYQQSGYSPVSLDVQFVQFKNFHNRSQISRKQDAIYQTLLPEADTFSQGLYTIDIGQNDMTLGYALKMSPDQVKASIPNIIEKYKTVVKGLYGEGARYFWIHNTGPAGCLPYVLTDFAQAGQEDRVGCSQPYNEVAQYYNSKLKEAVVQLRQDLPSASIIYVDIYSVKYELIKNAWIYGFSDPLKACCGTGGKYNFNSLVTCGATGVVNGTQVTVTACTDPSKRVNWDGIHYTEAANKWIFTKIATGLFSDPPIPLLPIFPCLKNANQMPK